MQEVYNDATQDDAHDKVGDCAHFSLGSLSRSHSFCRSKSERKKKEWRGKRPKEGGIEGRLNLISARMW